MTRLTEHRPANGHAESVPLTTRLADFDAIGPVTATPAAEKRKATATVRRLVDDPDAQQELLRILYQKQHRRPLGTVEQAAAAKRGRPVGGVR